MKTILAIFALLLPFGCATTEKYDKLLSGLVGKPESLLISDWGKPQETKDLGNGDRILTYNQNRSVQAGGFTLNPTNNYNIGRISSDFKSSTTNSPRSFFMPTTPTRDINLSCITRFTIHNNLVQGFSWEGEDCVSSF